MMCTEEVKSDASCMHSTFPALKILHMDRVCWIGAFTLSE